MTTSNRSKGRSGVSGLARPAPAAEFKNPTDVATSCAIGQAEKRKILDQREADAQALSRASNEGMTGGEPNHLAEVQRARRKVKRATVLRDRRTAGKRQHAVPVSEPDQ